MNVDNKIVSYKKLLFVIVFLITINGFTQTITVSGSDWNINTNSTPSFTQPTEAGNDYSGTYESPSNQVLISVAVPILLGSGKVSVRYEPDPLWHSSLIIETRKTGNGSGLCLLCSITPSGVSTYQVVTTQDTEVFRVFAALLNLANASDIPIQFRLSGVSVTLPVDEYRARIVFTISPL
jgi:hypothetical protein